MSLKLTLQSVNRTDGLVAAEQGGLNNEKLIANRHGIGPWEKFNVEIVPLESPPANGPRLLEVRFQANDTGKYVKVDTSDNNVLKASESTAGNASVFQMFPTGIGLGFRDKGTDNFITVNSSTLLLEANSSTIGSLDELFQIEWVR